MRCYSYLLVLMLFVLGTGFAHAAKADGESEKHEPTKIKVAFRDANHEEKEESFDMSKPADQKRMIDLLSTNQHIEHIAKDEKPDVFGIKFWDTSIWSIVVFVLVFFVLAKFAWKPMLQGLNEREERIRTALDLAERTRKEAAEQHAKLQAQITAGAAEVREKIEEARRDALALKDQMMAEARAEIQAERARLHREIETAKDAALEELWEKSVGLATRLSIKAIRRQLTAEDHRRLLDETLAELKPAGNTLDAS